MPEDQSPSAADPILAADEATYPSSYLEWSDRGAAGIGRYLIGLLLALFTFLVLAGLGVLPVTIIDPDYKDSLVESNAVLLLSFVIPFIGIPLIVHWIHKRPAWSVAMPRPRFEAWNLFCGLLVGLGTAVVAFLVVAVLGLIDVETVGFDWGAFLPVLVIGTVGILIQASTEEMLFRGYLAQFVRRLVKNPYIVVGVPAFIFALPHIANIAAFGGGPLVLAPYFISGLLYGWAAYRTGSLFLGAGLHWANNLSGLVLFGIRDDVLKTVAPLQFDTPSLTTITVLTAAQAVFTIAILLPLIRRREAATADRAA